MQRVRSVGACEGDVGGMGERVEVAVVGGGIGSCDRVCSAVAFTLHVLAFDREGGLPRLPPNRRNWSAYSGIYYKPGSWKAVLCRRGRTAMLRFLSTTAFASASSAN